MPVPPARPVVSVSRKRVRSRPTPADSWGRRAKRPRHVQAQAEEVAQAVGPVGGIQEHGAAGETGPCPRLQHVSGDEDVEGRGPAGEGRRGQE